MGRQSKDAGTKTPPSEFIEDEEAEFLWHAQRIKAAYLLSEGYTNREVAKEVGVAEMTIQRWKSHIAFSAEVDRLTIMTGIALRAERLRIVKQVVRQKIKADGKVMTRQDILQWLKFAQSETDGAKLDLTALKDIFDNANDADIPEEAE
jgi:hypothetical protein